MLEVLWEKLAAGGWLMLPILAVSVAAWYLILARFFSLRAVIAANRKAVRLLAARGAPPGLPAGSAAARFRERTGAGAASPRILEEELLADERAGLRHGLDTIGKLAAVAPLLGLLGTVSGMILTFDAITVHGLGSPRAMAEGISQALITTQAGLLAAIPVLLAHRYLAKMAGRAEEWVRLSLARSVEVSATREAARD